MTSGDVQLLERCINAEALGLDRVVPVDNAASLLPCNGEESHCCRAICRACAHHCLNCSMNSVRQRPKAIIVGPCAEHEKMSFWARTVSDRLAGRLMLRSSLQCGRSQVLWCSLTWQVACDTPRSAECCKRAYRRAVRRDATPCQL